MSSLGHPSNRMHIHNPFDTLYQKEAFTMLKRISMIASFLTIATVAVMAMSTDTFHTRHHDDTTAATSRSTQNDELTAIARAEVPASAILTKYKEDVKDGETEIKFYDEATALTYEVTLYTNSKKVHEVEIKSHNKAGSMTIQKSEADIQQLILATYPDAKNIVIHLDHDDHTFHYDVHFTTTKYVVEAEINPDTGVFTNQELTYL